MRTLIYRQNKFFKIDTNQLSSKANKAAIINALYADIYVEFNGAENNPKYNYMDYAGRMEALNNFANHWLETKGLK